MGANWAVRGQVSGVRGGVHSRSAGAVGSRGTGAIGRWRTVGGGSAGAVGCRRSVSWRSRGVGSWGAAVLSRSTAVDASRGGRDEASGHSDVGVLHFERELITWVDRYVKLKIA